MDRVSWSLGLFSKNHLLGVSLTQNRETMAFQTLTTIGLICLFYHVSLEDSLSIPNGRCDLASATHVRKMHKKIFGVVHPEVLDND